MIRRYPWYHIMKNKFQIFTYINPDCGKRRQVGALEGVKRAGTHLDKKTTKMSKMAKS